MTRKLWLIAVILMTLLLASCQGNDQNGNDTSNNETINVVETSDNQQTTLVPEQLGDWTLVFNDEFDGESLDTSVWSYQLGTGSQYGLVGWGNDEAQYYQEDNVYLEDGALVIEARKEAKDGMSYTSGRITTKEGYSKQYGRFEARVSVTAEEGLWPAFWMLPEDETYGGWAASGEIDIMEIRGRFPMNVNGALHYGGEWPNNTYSSGYQRMEASIESFHVYAIEWEPGEIRWYVDDELYYSTSEWFSVTGDSLDNNTYPAPFDKPFYMILNLAVGGTYDDYRLPDDDNLPGKMLVDYVRVYELTGRDYMEAIEPVEEFGTLSEAAKQPEDGNYIHDVIFNGDITPVYSGTSTLHESLWNVVALPDFGGVMDYEVVEETDKRAINLLIDRAGHEAYSIQLIQNVPLAMNHVYELTFEAKAEAVRDIKIKVGAGASRGWMMYAPDTTIQLSEEYQQYTLQFKMKEATDEMARLEFNCGLSDVDVSIANVKLIDSSDE